MTNDIVTFVVCAAVIVAAGTYLSKFADAIAELTGLGRLLIGSVLLAGATSLPELTVDVSAVRLGATDLAVGDLLGSSLMNLLILAVLDLTHHSKGKMLSKQAAAHSLSGLVSSSLTCVVAIGLLTAKWLGPYAILGNSLAVYVVAGVYLLGVRLVYLDQRIALHTAKEAGAPFVENPPGMSLPKALLGFFACAAVILAAGPYLAHAADQIAAKTGLGGTFVGTTLVALCTSLPEIVSSFTALRLGAPDLAIGNVFGSNAFNMMLLVPVDFVHEGPLLGAVSAGHVLTCVTVVLATQVAVLGQLYQAERRMRFVEPDAWLVILTVVGGLLMVYFAG